MKGLTDKQTKRVNELLYKVLDDKKTLDKSELNELKTLLDKAHKAAENLSEVMEVGKKRSMIPLFEAQTNKAEFMKVGTHKKYEELSQEIEKIRKGFNRSGLTEHLRKEDEKAEFDRFYEEYADKYGRSL